MRAVGFAEVLHSNTTLLKTSCCGWPNAPTDFGQLQRPGDDARRMESGNSVVLVIEDAANVTQLIRAVLISDPLHIVTATDGAMARQLVEELVPDLVLLDLALGGVDGFEILDSIRTNPATAEIPVVIITAYGDSATAAEARDRGSDAFLAKPFQPAELRRVIDRFLPRTKTVAS